MRHRIRLNNYSSLDLARDEIDSCCQTLCNKDIVRAALPQITKEEAANMFKEGKAWQEVIEKIYG